MGQNHKRVHGSGVIRSITVGGVGLLSGHFSACVSVHVCMSVCLCVHAHG